MLHRFVLCLICLIPLSPPANAEIYKWVDENGQIHYSDTPINKKSKKFEYKPNVIGQENFKDTPEITKHQKNSQVIQNIPPLKSNNSPSKEDREKRKRYCQEAKQDLHATQQANLLYEYDDKGERYFLNKQQRKKAIEKKQKIVKKWCG